MNRLPLLPVLLVSCLLLPSCVTISKKGQWMEKREEARAAGGSAWSNFVIDNLFHMDSYLSYDQQMSDVQSAIPHASPADQKFLAGVKQRMARDKVASAQRESAAEARQQQYTTPSSGSSYGSGSTGSTYSSPTSNAVENARRRQDQRDFDNALDSIEHGTATRPGNPYAD